MGRGGGEGVMVSPERWRRGPPGAWRQSTPGGLRVLHVRVCIMSRCVFSHSDLAVCVQVFLNTSMYLSVVCICLVKRLRAAYGTRGGDTRSLSIGSLTFHITPLEQ